MGGWVDGRWMDGGWMVDGCERRSGEGRERGQRRRAGQQAETIVSTRDWKESSEHGTERGRTRGRAGIGVSTEGEGRAWGLRTQRDFLGTPVTTQPHRHCPRALHRHLGASDPDLIKPWIPSELFPEWTQTLKASKSAHLSIRTCSEPDLNPTQVSMVMGKQTQRDRPGRECRWWGASRTRAVMDWKRRSPPTPAECRRFTRTTCCPRDNPGARVGLGIQVGPGRAQSREAGSQNGHQDPRRTRGPALSLRGKPPAVSGSNRPPLSGAPQGKDSPLVLPPENCGCKHAVLSLYKDPIHADGRGPGNHAVTPRGCPPA